MKKEIKDIILDVIGFIIVAYGTKTNDSLTTIFGLGIIFLDLKLRLNELENKLEDLNIKVDNYKDIIQLNEEIKQIKKVMGEFKK